MFNKKKGKEKKKKKEETYLTETNKYHLFAKTNSLLLFGGVIFLIYYTISSYRDLNSKLNTLEIFSRKNVYSTILMTPNGMPLNVKKIPISPDSEAFQLGIKNIIKMLIVDDITITSGFQKKVTKAEDIYNNVKIMQDFYHRFISRKDVKEEVSGRKSFTEYLNFLFTLHANDNLPETIKVLSSKVKEYIVTDNKYTAKIEFKVYYEGYLVEEDNTEKKIATITINLKGLYDLDESSIENPYGNKFTGFSVEYVKKRPYSEDIFFGATTDWAILNKEDKK